MDFKLTTKKIETLKQQPETIPFSHTYVRNLPNNSRNFQDRISRKQNSYQPPDRDLVGLGVVAGVVGARVVKWVSNKLYAKPESTKKSHVKKIKESKEDNDKSQGR